MIRSVWGMLAKRTKSVFARQKCRLRHDVRDLDKIKQFPKPETRISMPIERSTSSYSDTKERNRDKDKGEKSREERDSAPSSEPVSRVRDARARLNTVSSTNAARESSPLSRPKSVIGGSSLRDRDKERDKDKEPHMKDDAFIETKPSTKESKESKEKEAPPISKVRSSTTITRTSSSVKEPPSEKPKEETPSELKLKREPSRLKENPSSIPVSAPASATPAPATPAPTTHIPESSLKFHIWEDIQNLISKDKESFIFVVFGVSWCYPAKKSVKNLLRFAENVQDKYTNLKAFIIDEEKNREYCKTNNIIVGTPFLEVYYRGKRLAFSRGEWEPSKVLKGLLNPTQLEEIINSVLTSVEMGSQEIHVTF